MRAFRSKMMKSQKVLILGNKQYRNFKLDEIVDSFDIIYRFNLAWPGKNNGTKFGRLAMCSHVYNNFVARTLDKEAIIQIYECDYELSFLGEWYDFFQENNEKFEEMYHENEPNWDAWNEMLESYGSPYIFSKMASTGYSTIFRNLEQGSEIYVLGFTLCDDELRETVGDAPGIAIRREQGANCHSFSDERQILAWLHNSKKVDASLCMLNDTEEISFKPNMYNTEPSQFILKLLKQEADA